MRRRLLSWSSYSRRHTDIQQNCDFCILLKLFPTSGATSASTTVLDLGFGWPVIVLDNVRSEGRVILTHLKLFFISRSLPMTSTGVEAPVIFWISGSWIVSCVALIVGVNIPLRA